MAVQQPVSRLLLPPARRGYLAEVEKTASTVT